MGCNFFILTCNCQVVNVRDSGSQNFTIKYIGQIPSESDKKGKFIGKLGNIIAGSAPVTLNKPVNMVAADIDNIWILSQGNGAIIEYRNGEMAIPRILQRKKIEYPSLVGITSARDGNQFFTDSKLDKIFRLSGDGKELSELNDTLTLNQPTGIAYSELKNEIWVVETGAHRITILSLSGKVLKRIGRRGTAEGEFNFPTNIWIDREGFAYVVDALNCRVEIFDSNGKFISSFGESGDATGYLARPKGIATDSFGNIYISDALFNAVQVFDRKGRFLYYFGSQGQGKEQFWMPSGIYIDSRNFIYIADSYNVRIQIYQLINGGKL
jgi:DNA-binding beta-propeller fold protein YncE